MTDVVRVLAQLWFAVLLHLWQTSLVLTPLLLLGYLLRGAAPRQREAYWSLALAKLLLPLAIGAPLLHFLWSDLLAPFVDGPAPAHLQTLSTVTTVLVNGGNLDRFALADRPWFAALMLIATVCWLIGFLWIGLRTVVDLRRADTLRRRSRSFATLSGWQRDRVAAAAGRVGLPLSGLLMSDTTTMPAVTGLWRPQVILPVCLVRQLAADELSALLQHEQAHRLRRDPLRTLLRRITLALFFFYPPLYLILKRLAECAEFAADDRALAGGVGPRRFARALAVATRMNAGLEPLTTAAGTGGGSLLQRRLRRLTRTERKPMSRYRYLVALAALLVFAASFVAPTAGDPAPEPPTKDEPAAAEDSAQPVLIHFEPPVYPEDARKAQAEGRVVVKVLVGPEGTVLEAVILEAVEEFPSFGEAALSAAKACRFEPARQRGIAVKAWAALPFEFHLQ